MLLVAQKYSRVPGVGVTSPQDDARCPKGSMARPKGYYYYLWQATLSNEISASLSEVGRREELWDTVRFRK